MIPLSNVAQDAASGFSSKRALSDDEVDDEGVTRSMARRRKSDKPGDGMHICRDCKKEFKRPCDLTKHEKTHSRPWKCTEEKCKYFEHGWPTEKERDRHINDKHSAAPAQYKCLYPPCTYASKRESNCKQHMEKAHGWEYVRSKSNGRKKAQTVGSDRAPPTPLTPFLGTPQSATLSTPITPFIPSPSLPVDNGFDYYGGFGTPGARRSSQTLDETTVAPEDAQWTSPKSGPFNPAYTSVPFRSSTGKTIAAVTDRVRDESVDPGNTEFFTKYTTNEVPWAGSATNGTGSVNFFLQITGNIFANKYGTVYIKSLDSVDPFVMTVVNQLVNLTGVVISMSLVDRVGRRFAMSSKYRVFPE